MPGLFSAQQSQYSVVFSIFAANNLSIQPYSKSLLSDNLVLFVIVAGILCLFPIFLPGILSFFFCLTDCGDEHSAA